MVHPDYQYTPLLIAPMAHIIANGVYPVVFGSTHFGQRRAQGRNALVQIRSKPHSHFSTRTSFSAKNFQSTTPATVLFPERCWNPLISKQIRTTSSSIIRWSLRSFLPDMRWRKSPVRPSTLKKPPPSISVEKCDLWPGGPQSQYGIQNVQMGAVRPAYLKVKN